MKAEAQPMANKQEAVGTIAIALAMYSVLLVAYALMAADRYLFPVLAVNVRQEFGFSLAGTGLLSTVFSLGLGLGGLPTGYALSRFSRRSVLLVGITSVVIEWRRRRRTADGRVDARQGRSGVIS